MAFTVYAEGGTTRGVERECRHLVGNVMFIFLFTTDFLAVLYDHSPGLQFLFTQRTPSAKTSLLEGRTLPANLNVIRFVFFRVLMPLAEHPTCRT
jgi:hypothetical protein